MYIVGQHTLYITPNYSYLPLESPTITQSHKGGPQNDNILGPHMVPNFEPKT